MNTVIYCTLFLITPNINMNEQEINYFRRTKSKPYSVWFHNTCISLHSEDLISERKPKTNRATQHIFINHINQFLSLDVPSPCRPTPIPIVIRICLNTAVSLHGLSQFCHIRIHVTHWATLSNDLFGLFWLYGIHVVSCEVRSSWTVVPVFVCLFVCLFLFILFFVFLLFF
jgi:hypothetical protein